MIFSLRGDLGGRRCTLIYVKVTSLHWVCGEGRQSDMLGCIETGKVLGLWPEQLLVSLKLEWKLVWLGVRKKSLSARSLITWDSAFQVTISCSTAVTFKSYSLLLCLIVHSHSELFSEIVSLTSLTPGQHEKWLVKHSCVSLLSAGCCLRARAHVCVFVCVRTRLCVRNSVHV